MNICITGVTSGIGEALTKYLVKEGNVVYGLARRKELLQKMKESFPEGRFFYDVCNVENYSEVLRSKKRMEKSGFFPEVIILGAAIYEDDINPIYNYELYKKIFSINLFGSTNMIEAFLSDFITRKKGHFIVISSISAFRPYINSIAYSATKAAISMTFRGFDLNYRNKNIYFSNVYLGPVDTSMWKGKKSFLVAKPDKIAKNIASVIKTRKSTYFFPFLSTSIFKLTRILPDNIYVFLTGAFRDYKK